jgi:hypothetical protein
VKNLVSELLVGEDQKEVGVTIAHHLDVVGPNRVVPAHELEYLSKRDHGPCPTDHRHQRAG